VRGEVGDVYMVFIIKCCFFPSWQGVWGGEGEVAQISVKWDWTMRYEEHCDRLYVKNA